MYDEENLIWSAIVNLKYANLFRMLSTYISDSWLGQFIIRNCQLKTREGIFNETLFSYFFSLFVDESRTININDSWRDVNMILF